MKSLKQHLKKHAFFYAMLLIGIPIGLCFVSGFAYLPSLHSIRYPMIITILSINLGYVGILCVFGCIMIFVKSLRIFQKATFIAIMLACLSSCVINSVGTHVYGRDIDAKAQTYASYQVKIGATVYHTNASTFLCDTRRDRVPYLISDIVPINDHIVEIKWTNYQPLKWYSRTLEQTGIDYDAMGVCPAF